MIWVWGNATAMCVIALVIPCALIIDRYFGEPPAALHSVVWMGSLLGWLERRLPMQPASIAFFAGSAGWFVGATVSVLIAAVSYWAIFSTLFAVESSVSSLIDGGALYTEVNYAKLGFSITCVVACALVMAACLKTLLSLRLLIEECSAVESALALSLEKGRKQTARICSRDTTQLSATELRETAVESLSENLTDSVVAPLLWFAVAGLPGAALYRWANTADAMWGYRDIKREWFGKTAARIDDLLNLLPARLTALTLYPQGFCKALRTEASKTPSPNGGWPMASVALKLGVRLGKPGTYTLNPTGRRVNTLDIAKAVRLITQASWRFTICLSLLLCIIALAIH